jgi:hypothetical protein
LTALSSDDGSNARQDGRREIPLEELRETARRLQAERDLRGLIEHLQRGPEAPRGGLLGRIMAWITGRRR